MSTHSIPRPHQHIPLVARTIPQRAVAAHLDITPRAGGAHRAAPVRPTRRRVAAMPHLTVLALGAVLASGVYLIGGPW